MEIWSETGKYVDALEPSVEFESGGKGQSRLDFLCFFSDLPEDFNCEDDLLLERLHEQDLPFDFDQ